MGVEYQGGLDGITVRVHGLKKKEEEGKGGDTRTGEVLGLSTCQTWAVC